VRKTEQQRDRATKKTGHQRDREKERIRNGQSNKKNEEVMLGKALQ